MHIILDKTLTSAQGLRPVAMGIRDDGSSSAHGHCHYPVMPPQTLTGNMTFA